MMSSHVELLKRRAEKRRERWNGKRLERDGIIFLFALVKGGAMPVTVTLLG